MRLLRCANLVLILMIVLLPASNVASQNDQPITDDEVNALAEELYCPVCENVPLDVCPTKACAQWRNLIREKMELGWSEKQIKVFFAEQYGDQVLAVPPREGFNWLIYVLPPLVVIAGVVIVARAIRRSNKSTATPASIDQKDNTKINEDLFKEIEQDLRRET